MPSDKVQVLIEILSNHKMESEVVFLDCHKKVKECSGQSLWIWYGNLKIDAPFWDLSREGQEKQTRYEMNIS